MSDSDSYRLNTPLVASEFIDNEAVLIHFESGCYYSADEVGAAVLEMLGKQASVPRMVRSLVGAYAGEAVAIEQALRRFLSELLKEGLVVPASIDDEPPDNVAGKPSAERLPFTDPVLHKFSDLQNLLMLDPIHDTEEWPAVKRDQSVS